MPQHYLKPLWIGVDNIDMTEYMLHVIIEKIAKIPFTIFSPSIQGIKTCKS